MLIARLAEPLYLSDCTVRSYCTVQSIIERFGGRQAKNVQVGQMSVSSEPRSRRDQKRAAIVAVAKELFFKEGYAGASMAQISARVGGSKATLYSHFRSKEELLLAVVEDVTGPTVGEALGHPPSEDDFPAWLQWFGDLSLRRISSYEFVSLQRLAAGEALRFPEIGRTFYEAGIQPGLRTMAGYFAVAMDKGILRRADPLVAVEQFLELCTGWLLRRVVWNIQPPPREDEIVANVSAAVSAFMNGYAPTSTQ